MQGGSAGCTKNGNHGGKGSSKANGKSKLSENNNSDMSAGRKSAASVLVPGQGSESFTPIKSLNTFLFDWKIKARVTKKHNKKTWKNSRGQGTLLNVELIDNQGTQIQATFFNDQADHYENRLVENRVYLFANGQVKMANQKYTSIKNDYSIVFDKQSEIEEVDDDASIQNRGFCFTTIQEINDFE